MQPAKKPELHIREGRLGLFWEESDKPQWFCVDYLSSDFQRRLKSVRVSKDLLARALGAQPGVKICDLTMGLGYDAVQMASLGCTVYAWERNELIFRLVEDGRKRWLESAPEKEEIFQIHQGNAADAALPVADAYYMDPMYPTEKRSLPKKELRALRLLAGDDKDAGDLFARVREQARAGSRIVVKRPDKAPAIAGNPDFSLPGTTVRFDVYLRA